MRTVAALFVAFDIVGVGGHCDHRSCFDLKTGEATTASGGRQGRNINDKYSHMQKYQPMPHGIQKPPKTKRACNAGPFSWEGKK
jgi:hypothetical protein